jgi:hypothetical protein
MYQKAKVFQFYDRREEPIWNFIVYSLKELEGRNCACAKHLLHYQVLNRFHEDKLWVDILWFQQPGKWKKEL